MGKPCIVVELDPARLDSENVVLAAALSLFHLEVEIVLVLRGVSSPSAEQAEAIGALCLSLVGDAPLPDIVLESARDAELRGPLLTVRAADDPSAVVEAVVMLTSLAMRFWEDDRGEPTDPSQVAEFSEAEAWIAERNGIIAQRDTIARKQAAPDFVLLVDKAEALGLMGPLLSALHDAGWQTEIVVVPTGNHDTFRATRDGVRSCGRTARNTNWWSERLDRPDGPRLVAGFLGAADSTWPEAATPQYAAEYGVRIVYFAGQAERLESDVLPESYDRSVHRLAWRTYVANQRHAHLFAEHNAVGDDAVRVVGSLRSDRVFESAGAELPADWSEAIGDRKVVLWAPTIGFRGGESDLRRHLDTVVEELTERDLVGILHLDASRREQLRLLHDGPGLLERLDTLHASGRLLIDESDAAVDAIRRADALVTGLGGPIAEFVVQGRPVLYCARAAENSIPTGTEFVLAFDIDIDGSGIGPFLDGVVMQRDHRAGARRLAADAFFRLNDGGVAQRIADDLTYSLILAGDPSPTAWAGPPLLSVAMIVKNEEANLPRALASVATLGDLVHEVCIYDTGSEDSTVELAEAAGARVQRGYWDADFSRARNEAIAMCRTRWVLILDADERVTALPSTLRRALLQALTAGADVDTLDIRVRDVKADETTNTEWVSRRLLRPERATYMGEVHEGVYRFDSSIPVSVELSPEVVSLVHDGYNDIDVLASKLRRNHEITVLEVAAREQANDTEGLIQALVDRARSSLTLGDPEEALADYERVRRMSSSRTYRWWGMEQYAELLLRVGRVDDAAGVVAELRRSGASPSFGRWLEARVAAARGDLETSHELLAPIEGLTDSLGLNAQQTKLLEAKLEVALRLGRFDEALSFLIPLMATWGQIGGRGELLQRLWGDRPAALLAQFVLAGDEAHVGAIARELSAASGRGPELAEAVREVAGTRGSPVG